MGRQQNSAKLIKFLLSVHWRDGPMDETDDNQSLVESGLVDSPAALRMVVYLH